LETLTVPATEADWPWVTDTLDAPSLMVALGVVSITERVTV
jgi:hypothetical protein